MFEVDKDSATIRAYGEIGHGEITAKAFNAGLAAMGGRDVTLEIDSEGGSVRDGVNIYNMIDQYSGIVTVHINAWAASIASYFPMAANEVFAFDNSTLMIHRAWTIALGDAPEMRATADVLEKLDGDIARGYARKANPDPEYWLELMGKTTYFSAAEALAEGLIDGIISRSDDAKNRIQGPSRIAGKAWLTDEAKAEIVQASSRPRLARYRTQAASVALSARRLRLDARN